MGKGRAGEGCVMALGGGRDAPAYIRRACVTISGKLRDIGVVYCSYQRWKWVIFCDP